jgi:hypothetical protein
MTDTTKTFAHGDKKRIAIQIIEANHDKDFFEVANMISIALDINKYSARSYYKYMVKNGWVSNVPADATPWKTSKEAAKAAKAPKTVKLSTVVKKASKEFVKKVKAAEVQSEPEAPVESPVQNVTEKPATAMIREFVRKQKLAARQA